MPSSPSSAAASRVAITMAAMATPERPACGKGSVTTGCEEMDKGGRVWARKGALGIYVSAATVGVRFGCHTAYGRCVPHCGGTWLGYKLCWLLVHPHCTSDQRRGRRIQGRRHTDLTRRANYEFHSGILASGSRHHGDQTGGTGQAAVARVYFRSYSPLLFLPPSRSPHGEGLT